MNYKLLSIMSYFMSFAANLGLNQRYHIKIRN